MTESRLEFFDTEELRRLSGIKWSRDGADVVPAWVADMDLRTPAFIRDAVSGLVQRSDLGYNRQIPEAVPPAFARWQEEHHGWSVDPGQVRLFCDVLHAIDTALWLSTEPGDGIVLLTPIYPPFLKAIDGGGRRLVDVPLDPDGWRLDPERLEAAIDPTTKVVLTCNPHNPTGRVFTRDELELLARVVVEHDLLLVSDEVWGDLLHPGGTHIPVASLGPEIAARTVTVSSASKAFNMAGLRCAVAHLGDRALAQAIEALPAHLLGAVSTPGAMAALAAWTDGGPWLETLRRHLTDRREQLSGRLAAELPKVGFQPPEATYLAWLDFRALELGADPQEHLYERAGVALSPGPDFGIHGHGWTRLNFATSASILDEIIDRMVAAVG